MGCRAVGGVGAGTGSGAVLCLVRARGVQHYEEHGVLVVSIDRLAPALRSLAGVCVSPNRFGA